MYPSPKIKLDQWTKLPKLPGVVPPPPPEKIESWITGPHDIGRCIPPPTRAANLSEVVKTIKTQQKVKWVFNENALTLQNRARLSEPVEMSTISPMLQSKRVSNITKDHFTGNGKITLRTSGYNSDG